LGALRMSGIWSGLTFGVGSRPLFVVVATNSGDPCARRVIALNEDLRSTVLSLGNQDESGCALREGLGAAIGNGNGGRSGAGSKGVSCLVKRFE
jgi:hypothetical protein